MFGSGALDSITTVLGAQKDRLEDLERADRVQPKAHVKGTVSGSYTLTAFDFVVPVSSSGGDVPITLPSALTARDALYVVIKVSNDGNVVKVFPDGLDTINGIAGPTTYDNSTQWRWMVFVSNNVNGWYAVTLTP